MFRDKIRHSIQQAIGELQKEARLPEFSIPDFSVEAPEDPAHGDYATNAALVMTKVAGKPPREIAATLSQKLAAHSDMLAKAEPAGSGFVNLWLSDDVRKSGLEGILEQNDAYADASAKPEKIQVEFISANPTGPLTLANGRGGFLGDVLCNVLKAQGYSVEREYYINDAGNQIRALGLSLLAAGGMAPDGEEYYHGGYIAEWIKRHGDIARKHQDDPEALGRLAASDFLRDLIQHSVEEKMKVQFDHWTSEYADLHQKGYVKRALSVFSERGLVYEREKATWLKTTAYGDDKDRVLVTADGAPTYLLADGGHYLQTQERGFGGKILILGADHHGYVPRLQAVAKIVGLPSSEVIIMQLVRLTEGGKEVWMSKRKGVYVTIDELIDEVGLDQVRYFFLEKNPETHIDFDLALAKKRSKENPVFYIQYAHARLTSLERKGLITPSNFNFSALKSEEEQALIRQLLRFPEILEDIARDYRVSRLVRYTYDLARDFHLFYEASRILDATEPERSSRMALAAATAIVLRKSLSLLGISAPEEM